MNNLFLDDRNNSTKEKFGNGDENGRKPGSRRRGSRSRAAEQPKFCATENMTDRVFVRR